MTVATTQPAPEAEAALIQAIAQANRIDRRTCASALETLGVPDRIRFTKWLCLEIGGSWIGPDPQDSWATVEGELTMFGVLAWGTDLPEAIANWIKIVVRIETSSWASDGIAA